MTLDRAASHFAREYDRLSFLYGTQPAPTQHFLDQQAAAIVSALERDNGRIRYQFPDRIVLEGGEILDLPAGVRSRVVRKPLSQHSQKAKVDQLARQLNSLEQGLNPGLAVCGELFRFVLARTIVYLMLPDGGPVRYRAEFGDDIPSIPLEKAIAPALMASTDAVTEAEETQKEEGRLQVPFAAEARGFFLPQWVAFGENDRLLAGSLREAEACIASLENAVRLLQAAVSIWPSVVADETYQRKRAGLLGQLVNQGRALARATTQEIIARIRDRAQSGTLNRGLSLSLPYFDDDDLVLRYYPVEIIPAGRVMFAPAFVVLAMRRTEEQIREDYQLNPSTRKHLLMQLKSIENAFTMRFSH
jgi:hypothetical protein